MNVCLDSQPLLGRRSGIGRYVERLANYFERDQEIELFYWFNQLLKQRHHDLSIPEARVVNSHYPYKVIRRLMKPSFLHDIPVDFLRKMEIFHGGNFTTFNTRKAKNIITIHDLAFLPFPETTSDRIYKHHTKWIPYSISKADHIIADSYQTKEDIMSYYKVSENNISVIHLAADKMFKPMDVQTISQVKEKYHLPEEYLLYVGTIEPRKNIPFLLEAFAKAKNLYKFRQKLVIAGGRGWKYNAVFETITKYELEDDVIFTGYVDDEDLPALYSGSSIFLFPSKYEGFGLPVLEAMQCGVPVIAANNSSLPEIVRDAGQLVSIDNDSEIVDCIGELLANQAKLKILSEAAIFRARHFSWEKVAQETKEVYKGVLA